MTRKLIAGLVLAAAAFGVVSAVQAAIPDTQGVIHGCYQNDNGSLRVIDPSSSKKDLASCKNNESSLNWSQTGPQGPAGPPGPGEKMVVGKVTGDGSILAGSGFSIVHDATGDYEIVFPSGTFTDVSGPALTVLPTSNVVALEGAESQDSAEVTFEYSGTTTPQDTGFSFVAVQP